MNRVPNVSKQFGKMVEAKKIVLVKKFEGVPKVTDFRLVEERLPPLNEGGGLC